MHEGEIWRKDGNHNWLKVVEDWTEDSVMAGYGVKVGNYSETSKRVNWSVTMLMRCKTYKQFSSAMKEQHRWLK